MLRDFHRLFSKQLADGLPTFSLVVGIVAAYGDQLENT